MHIQTALNLSHGIVYATTSMEMEWLYSRESEREREKIELS